MRNEDAVAEGCVARDDVVGDGEGEGDLGGKGQPEEDLVALRLDDHEDVDGGEEKEVHADQPLTGGMGDAGAEGATAGAGEAEEDEAGGEAPDGDEQDDQAREKARANHGVRQVYHAAALRPALRAGG